MPATNVFLGNKPWECKIKRMWAPQNEMLHFIV